MIDHDRLFKELITQFFFEFIQLFLPKVARYLDRNKLEFLDKEVFTDITAGKRHQADVVARARFKGQPTFFLVHIEHQATKQSQFPKRMFRYFARLHEKYDLPVYPIAIFSYDKPHSAEPANYSVTFPDREILSFNYTAIQLNRLNWRDFVRQPNPVASALMAKMNIATKDRPRVKLECLRLLATLRLNPAKMHLIAGFVDRYLELTTAEYKTYRREVAQIAPEEKEKLMYIETSWEKKGRKQGLKEGLREGRREGQVAVVLDQLSWRLGDIGASSKRAVKALTQRNLTTLSKDLLDFTTLADLKSWLAKKR